MFFASYSFAGSLSVLFRVMIRYSKLLDPDMEAFDLLINTLLEAKQVASALPNRNEK